MKSRPFDSLPRHVRVRDMTLRDGLQNLPVVLSTSLKLELYDALVSAGIRDLQVTSFVNPERLPQLADAEKLWTSLLDRPERKSVLVGNTRGFERAIAAGVEEIESVISLSETYNIKNVRRTTRQSLDEIIAMAGRSTETGTKVTAALGNCFHCVFDGPIEQTKVLETIDELSRSGIREVAICDTTGYATPEKVYALMDNACTNFPRMHFGAHLHDTRGRGLANAIAALNAGVEWFDATVGGLGGSPFAPGMGGNLSLETLADALTGMNIETGIDAERILSVGSFVRESISRCTSPALSGFEGSVAC